MDIKTLRKRWKNVHGNMKTNKEKGTENTKMRRKYFMETVRQKRKNRHSDTKKKNEKGLWNHKDKQGKK